MKKLRHREVKQWPEVPQLVIFRSGSAGPFPQDMGEAGKKCENQVTFKEPTVEAEIAPSPVQILRVLGQQGKNSSTLDHHFPSAPAFPFLGLPSLGCALEAVKRSSLPEFLPKVPPWRDGK